MLQAISFSTKKNRTSRIMASDDAHIVSGVTEHFKRLIFVVQSVLSRDASPLRKGGKSVQPKGGKRIQLIFLLPNAYNL
jgi:hypothetical protein